VGRGVSLSTHLGNPVLLISGGESDNGEGQEACGEREEEGRVGPDPLGPLRRGLPREHPHGCCPVV